MICRPTLLTVSLVGSSSLLQKGGGIACHVTECVCGRGLPVRQVAKYDGPKGDTNEEKGGSRLVQAPLLTNQVPLEQKSQNNTEILSCSLNILRQP